jgi:predicted nucleic acid-binding Zn ribbon protein
MSDDPIEDCQDENCDGTVKKLISAGAGLIFKGSGFYITDYRDSSYSEAAKKDQEGKTGSSDKKEGSDSTKSNGNKSEGKSEGEKKLKVKNLNHQQTNPYLLSAIPQPK